MKVLLLVLFIIAIICLQIYLSKKESKWPGLILPIISVLISIFLVLNISLFGNESSWQIIYTLCISVLITNIPTAVFLAIYFKYHPRLKV